MICYIWTLSADEWSVIHTSNNLWHTKDNNCTAIKKEKWKQCSINADFNKLHFFFTKVCNVIKKSCYRFFISPSVKCLFLYLTLMWQTVCFVISAKDIKCLFWLGGVRLAVRMREHREDVKGREMSIYEECLSEHVVYTWQTLIIIIIIVIIICKGHSKQRGYLSAAAELWLSLIHLFQ